MDYSSQLKVALCSLLLLSIVLVTPRKEPIETFKVVQAVKPIVIVIPKPKKVEVSRGIKIEEEKVVPVAKLIEVEPKLVGLTIPKGISGKFKTWMDYRKITNKGSKQYRMQLLAHTNTEGFRVYEDKYMVAVGTYYAKECGKNLLITLDSGKSINAVVGDIKSDRHTDSTHRYMNKNGNIVEFIVDGIKISSLSRKAGDVSYSDLEGKITKIDEVIE